MTRPSVKTKCIADSYARKTRTERIVEVHSTNLRRGCLIAVREVGEGEGAALRVEVYRADAGIVVLAGGHVIEAHEQREPGRIETPGRAAPDWHARAVKLLALIDKLARMPADDFYKPGDYAAGEVVSAWREAGAIVEGLRD